MDFQRSRRQFKDINLTALVDIVFHLMVFVMLTTTFVVSESMELSLPSGHAGKSTGTTRIMRVQVESDGSVQVDGSVMNLEQMNTALAERVAQDPDAKIAILTTDGVSVQQLISVMDSVYLTGGRNVQVDKAGG